MGSEDSGPPLERRTLSPWRTLQPFGPVASQCAPAHVLWTCGRRSGREGPVTVTAQTLGRADDSPRGSRGPRVKKEVRHGGGWTGRSRDGRGREFSSGSGVESVGEE